MSVTATVTPRTATPRPATPRPATPTGASRATTGVSKRPFTAFVFAGGASLGALQVGMLRALYEREIEADVFVGTSIGALNAAFAASRPQTPATADELARVWRSLRREDLFPVSVRTLVGACLRPTRWRCNRPTSTTRSA
jgi:predicted acylesterase/phospholipase RssA